ncbi:MAG: hypothetical protein ACE5GY_08550 [Thermodesulfobacteriota bacterium]
MMQGRQFLSTARLLLRDGVDEAAHRSVISRAYYACFIETTGIAWTECLAITRRDAGGFFTHDILQKSLKNGGETQAVRNLGTDLASFRANRKKADYLMGETVTEIDAKDAIEFAESFLADLDTIPAQSIGKAMDRYKQITGS